MKKRTVLLPNIMNPLFQCWFEEEKIDYKLFLSSDHRKCFSDAIPQMLDYVRRHADGHYLILSNLPSKRNSPIDGLELARSLTPLAIPVVIFSSSEKLDWACKSPSVWDVPKNIVAMCNDVKASREQIMKIVKSAICIDRTRLMKSTVRNRYLHLETTPKNERSYYG